MSDEIKKVQIKPDLTKYVKGKNGTFRSQDEVAEKLDGLHLEEVYGLVSGELQVPVSELKDKYGHLNPGLQRMSLGGRLRGVARKAETAAKKAALKAEKEAAKAAAQQEAA
jgi:hypothetical protein